MAYKQPIVTVSLMYMYVDSPADFMRTNFAYGSATVRRRSKATTVELSKIKYKLKQRSSTRCLVSLTLCTIIVSILTLMLATASVVLIILLILRNLSIPTVLSDLSGNIAINQQIQNIQAQINMTFSMICIAVYH